MPAFNLARAAIRPVLIIILLAGGWYLAEGRALGQPASTSHRPSEGLPFRDVASTDWFFPYVLDLWSGGSISGYSDGTFRPYATISRGQFTKVLVLATNIRVAPPDEATFTDVPTGSPFFGYVEAGSAAGLVGGYECGSEGEPCDNGRHRYFRPGANVTRGQAAKMIAGAFGWEPYEPPAPIFADVAVSNPFYGYVNEAARQQVITGYMCGGPGEPCGSPPYYFRPFGSATRVQAVKIISEARDRSRSSPTPAATGSLPRTATSSATVTPSAGSATAQATASSSVSATRSPVSTRASSMTPTSTGTRIPRPSATATRPPASSPTRPAATPTWTVIPGGSGITANDPISCSLWPADNIWNRPVDGLPTHVASDVFVSTIGSGDSLSNGFASRMWQGASIGVPYNVVPTVQPLVPVTFTDYPDMSEPGPYPYPTYAFVQGGTYLTPVPPGGDRHVSVLRAGSCTLYETWHARPQSDGSWTAANGAVFNLLSNQLRPDGWTSGDAAGFAILPGLVRYDEVSTGQITHAIRFTAPPASIRDTYAWPARHTDGESTDQSAPPMGTRFRLKAGVDISGYPPRLRTILQALKTYGMFLADGGDPWAIGGAPDQRWDDDELQLLHGINGSDFEAVDESGLMVDPNSGQSR